jgi:hypothetical protein
MTLLTTHTRVPTVRSNTITDSQIARTPFRANPIRHTREGHGFGSDHSNPASHSRRVSIDALNRPGGMSNTSVVNSCDGTDPSATPVILTKVVTDDTCQSERLKNRSRPASTIISPSYSANTHEYLKMRARTFEQNEAPHQLHTVSGTDADGNPTYCEVDHQPVPKNHKYFARGAVSSGTRLERLKYEATRQRKGVRNIPPLFANNAACKKC